MLFSRFFRNNIVASSLISAFLLVFSGTQALANEPVSTDSTAAVTAEAGHEEEKFSPVEMIMHHISDAHDWHFFDLKGADGELHPVSIPLPVILLTEGNLDIFMSSGFHHGHSDVVKGDRTYRMDHGKIVEASGKTFTDFSITKNVASMLISVLLLISLFGAAGGSYKKHGLGAPKGVARILEPLVVYVRDEIAIPNIGEKKYARYMPYLLTAFFFIWINNLLGLFPGGANFTGNIAVTLTLAVFTMIITNVSGTKTYWGHIFKPHVPLWLYPIMIPVELVGVLSKPFALMIRLFANITAGHIIILSLVSLIFIFKNIALAPVSVGFVLFISCLELLVAALQAYVFTLLSALFIGLALEEPHHEHEAAH